MPSTPSTLTGVAPIVQSTTGQVNVPGQSTNVANINNIEYNNPKGGLADEIANVGYGIEAESFAKKMIG